MAVLTPAQARALGFTTPTGTDRIRTGDNDITTNATVAGGLYVETRDEIAAVTEHLTDRTLLVVDAPAAGPWLVGTNWRGTEQAPASPFADIDAPAAGVWSTGTDWRGVNLTSADTTTGDPVDVAARGTTTRPLVARTPDGLRRLTSDSTRLVAWGDSLTAGYPSPPFASDGSQAWPAVLDAAWTAGTVTNAGMAGQTAEQIALRQGGLALTVDAMTIPAGTSAVAMPAQQVIPAAFGYPFTGTLAGVPVTITCDAAGAWTLQRATAGTATPVPTGTPFDPGTDTHADAVTVIMAGRNDALGLTSGNLPTRVGRVIAAVAAMIGRLTPAHPAYLIVGTITGTSETAGTLAHQFVTSVNDELSALYPGRFFDVRRYLIDEALADAGITPTAADSTAIAGDTYPPSLSHDGLHYTPVAASLIAARIRDHLDQKGYLS